MLSANAERGSLADVRAEVIRELIRVAEADLTRCPCGGTGVASERFEVLTITRGPVPRVGRTAGVMVRRERCHRCAHLRGVIVLAREMVPGV